MSALVFSRPSAAVHVQYVQALGTLLFEPPHCIERGQVMHDVLSSTGRPGYQPALGYLNLGKNEHRSRSVPVAGINYQFTTPLQAQA